MMLTFKVEAEYGTENRRFVQNIISQTPEMAAEVATRLIRGKLSGNNASTQVTIIEVREVRI
jgi:hypothetical protein